MNPSKLKKLLSDYIPADLSLKSLAKINPQIKSFMTVAASAGYGANEIKKFFQGFMKSTPGQEVELENLERKRQSGQMRSADVLQQRALQERENQGVNISPSAIGGIAGLAGLAGGGGLKNMLGGLAGDNNQPEQMQEQISEQAQEPQEEQRQPSYFEKAMKGISFFDIPDEQKPNVSTLRKRLDALEGQGTPWKDRSVQKVVKGLRNMIGNKGFVNEELERVKGRGIRNKEALLNNARQNQQQNQPQQQNQSSVDSQLASILQSLASEFLK